MELIDYLRLLRRRWLYVVTLTLLGLLVAVAYVLTTTRLYTASADLFVGSNRTTATTPSAAQSTQTFTLDRMPSYAALVRSTVVLQQVRDRSQSGLSTASLSSDLSADQIGKTVLLRVTARDTNPQRVALIANLTATVLGENISQLERPPGGGASPIAPTVTRTDSAPSQPSSPNKTLAVLIGLVAGLGLGLLAAALRDEAARAQVTAGPQLAVSPRAGDQAASGQQEPRASDG